MLSVKEINMSVYNCIFFLVLMETIKLSVSSIGTRALTISLIVFTTTESNTLATTAATPALACYECEEKFTENWDPYTDCQVRPNATGLKECLSSETYCMVQRITVKQITINIKRQCTKECWYGCRAKGFGVTQVMCTSCCQSRACNTGSQATRLLPTPYCTLCVLGILLISYNKRLL